MSLTPERLAMLKVAHYQDPRMSDYCLTCDEGWPCDTIRLLTLLAEKDAKYESLRDDALEEITRLTAERDAALVKVAAVEALCDFGVYVPGFDDAIVEVGAIRDALATGGEL